MEGAFPVIQPRDFPILRKITLTSFLFLPLDSLFVNTREGFPAFLIEIMFKQRKFEVKNTAFSSTERSYNAAWKIFYTKPIFFYLLSDSHKILSENELVLVK